MPGKPFAVLALLLVASVSASFGSARAAVLTVTDCGDTTPGGAPGQLRRLITDATPGDTIQIPACVIKLTGAAGEDANAEGDLDVGKNLTIEGAGLRRTVIDGGALDRVFDVLTPATVTISDLLIRNGTGTQRGGGIRNTGTLTLHRVIVRANVATNHVTPEGGGIANDGTLTLEESTVDLNVATGTTGGNAGGIVNTGTLTLTKSTVSRNSSVGPQSGAGGIWNTGTLSIVDSTVSSNSTGRFAPGGVLSSSGLTVVGSAIVFNSSGMAGVNGVLSAGSATVTNTIVAGNSNTQCVGVTSLGGNLTSDGTCGAPTTGDAVNVNPGLGPLSEHGGLTQTHPLLAGSPAIDTALPGPCGPTDQRGKARPLDGDGDTTAVCDKGPFEFSAPIFADVGGSNVFRGAIEALFLNGITGGCSTTPLSFCPDQFVTRAQLAVFLVRALEGGGFVPPPATGVFADVPPSDPYAPWIEELFNDGITGGCAVAPPQFCPNASVTRAQLAVLVLRSLAGPGFIPPPATGFFNDVPKTDPFAPWVEEAMRRGLSSGCNASPPAFCPQSPATRAQIAVFLVRAFGFGF